MVAICFEEAEVYGNSLCVCLALQIDDLQQLNHVFATKALYR